MTVYIDVYFLNNFIIDLFLLIISGICLKRNIKAKKVVLGAISGSLYSVICLFEISYINFLKLPVAVLMIVLSFNLTPKEHLKQVLAFYMCSYILSGITLSINTLFKNKAVIFENQIYFSLPFINIVLAIFISVFFLNTFLKRLIKKQKFSSLYGKAEISVNNKTYLVKTFVDTGNFLKEPKENLPVCFLSPNVIKNKSIAFTHEIICTTVNGFSILKGFIPESFILNNKQEKAVFVISDAVKNEDYELLLHSDFILSEVNYVKQ